MKKTHLIEEYTRNNFINGTFNMSSQKTFFGSQLIEIEDEIIIKDEIITYSHNIINGEQNVDVSNEISISDDFFNIKKQNIKTKLFSNQSDIEKNEFPKWEFSVNVNKILNQYLFSLLKNKKILSGIKSEETIFNNINLALEEFIKFNILNRIKLSNINLFIQYADLGDSKENLFKIPQNKILKLDENLQLEDYQVFDIELNILQNLPENIKFIWRQKKSVQNYNFNYQYQLIFNKI